MDGKQNVTAPDKPTDDKSAEQKKDAGDTKEVKFAPPTEGELKVKSQEDLNEKPPEEEKAGTETESEATIPHTPLYHDWESRKDSMDKQNAKNEKKGEKQRDKWKNSIEFIMSSVSSAVGLGNIWRFSRTALENGGGAFLIPYLILVCLIARPLYYLEVAVGQFSSRGCAGMWDMVPFFRGVGYSMAFLSAITVTYYVAILAYCGAYVIFGFADPLSWKNCDKKLYVTRPFLEHHSYVCNYSEIQHKVVAQFAPSPIDNSPIEKVNAEMYFQYRVAQQLENIDDGIGIPLLHLALPLLFVWILIFLSMVFGAKSSGKTSYFTAIFPYVVIIITLIVACTMKGAGAGIVYFFTPDWDKIRSLDVWCSALSQCLFSLGIGYGQVIVYGSFNGFRQNLSRDAFIVSSMDTITSLLAGVTVFASLGVLAEAKRIHVSKVANGGFSLLFVSYAEVFLSFGPVPLPQIFSFLFFLMLVVLGIGSAAGYFHCVLTTIIDTFPRIAIKKRNKIILTGGLVIFFFLLGIPMTTPGGIFVINLLDEYSGAFIGYIVVLFELIGIAWIYGMKSFVADICFMTNSKLSSVSSILLMLWGYTMPFVLIGVLIVVVTEMREPTMKVNGKEVKFPMEVICVGAAMPILMILMIPTWGVYTFFSRKTGSWYKKFMASRCPNNKWGPKDLQDRLNWIEYKRDVDCRCWLYKKTIGRCCPGQSVEEIAAERQEQLKQRDEEMIQMAMAEA